MTTVHIAPPAIHAEVTAEQVVAYLLRPGSGWMELPRDHGNRIFRFRKGRMGEVVLSPRPNRRMMNCAVHFIARAERRHPSDVLAAIVGPARGVAVGVECERRRGWHERFMCGDRLVLPRDADERSNG